MFIFPIADQNPTKNKPVICYLIITFCFILFIWQQTLTINEQNNLILSFGMIPSTIFGYSKLKSELFFISAEFTMFTSMFLHGGWMHLLGNMGYLYIFGDNIEDCMGKIRFIVFFCLCGCIAATSQCLIDINSDIPMIGASGAISGILGGYLILYPNANIKVFVWLLIFVKTFNVPAMIVLIGWIIIQFFSIDFSSQNGGIAYAAHIGGFIGGLILIKIFEKKKNKFYQSTLPTSK